MRLSEAGNLDLGRTSDLVTDSMSSLGIGTGELQGYLDKVAKTASSSNTNIDAMMEAFWNLVVLLKIMALLTMKRVL